MARVPTPGGDANNWGTVLNDYLQQALAADGKLVTAATNPFTGLANTNLAGASQPGLVQLSNDFGNTATSPRVVGLQGRSVASSAPSSGDVLTWSSGSSTWLPQVPVPGSGLTGNIDAGSATTVYGGTTVIDCGGST